MSKNIFYHFTHKFCAFIESYNASESIWCVLKVSIRMKGTYNQFIIVVQESFVLLVYYLDPTKNLFHICAWKSYNNNISFNFKRTILWKPSNI